METYYFWNRDIGYVLHKTNRLGHSIGNTELLKAIRQGLLCTDDVKHASEIAERVTRNTQAPTTIRTMKHTR